MKKSESRAVYHERYDNDVYHKLRREYQAQLILETLVEEHNAEDKTARFMNVCIEAAHEAIESDITVEHSEDGSIARARQLMLNLRESKATMIAFEKWLMLFAQGDIVFTGQADEYLDRLRQARRLVRRTRDILENKSLVEDLASAIAVIDTVLKEIDRASSRRPRGEK